MTQRTWERKGFVWLTLSYHSPSLREAMQELKAGTWRRERKQSRWGSTVYWLAPGDWLSLLVPRRTACPEDDTTHSGLSPPSSIMNQENAPTDLPKGLADGGNCSAEIPSSR